MNKLRDSYFRCLTSRFAEKRFSPGRCRMSIDLRSAFGKTWKIRIDSETLFEGRGDRPV